MGMGMGMGTGMAMIKGEAAQPLILADFLTPANLSYFDARKIIPDDGCTTITASSRH